MCNVDYIDRAFSQPVQNSHRAKLAHPIWHQSDTSISYICSNLKNLICLSSGACSLTLDVTRGACRPAITTSGRDVKSAMIKRWFGLAHWRVCSSLAAFVGRKIAFSLEYGPLDGYPASSEYLKEETHHALSPLRQTIVLLYIEHYALALSIDTCSD